MHHVKRQDRIERFAFVPAVKNVILSETYILDVCSICFLFCEIYHFR